jgi:DNA-binding NarL/FixJ family response regulator
VETLEEHVRQFRVVIVDDHPMLRMGLRSLLEQEADLVVCGEAAGYSDGLRAVDDLRPDLAIIDLALADGSGLELIRHLHTRFPAIRLLVCSMHDETMFGRRVIYAGGHGFINKQQAATSCIAAVRCVLGGDIYLGGGPAHRAGDDGPAHAPSAVGELTDRELDVFRLIGAGLKTGQIAHQLHLSIKTVETHREKLKRKLDLQSSCELTRLAVQWSLEEA